MLSRLIGGIDQLTENIELELIGSGVANAHRAGAPVAGQPRHFPLDQLPFTGQAIHDLDLLRAARHAADRQTDVCPLGKTRRGDSLTTVGYALPPSAYPRRILILIVADLSPCLSCGINRTTFVPRTPQRTKKAPAGAGGPHRASYAKDQTRRLRLMAAATRFASVLTRRGNQSWLVGESY